MNSCTAHSHNHNCRNGPLPTDKFILIARPSHSVQFEHRSPISLPLCLLPDQVVEQQENEALSVGLATELSAPHAELDDFRARHFRERGVRVQEHLYVAKWISTDLQPSRARPMLVLGGYSHVKASRLKEIEHQHTSRWQTVLMAATLRARRSPCTALCACECALALIQVQAWS